MAEAKLKEALALIEAARNGPPALFSDRAGEASQLLQRTMRQLTKEAPDALDRVPTKEDKVGVLLFLVRVSERKARQNIVKDMLKVLLERKSWVSAAVADEDAKAQLMEFLTGADAQELAGVLSSHQPAATSEENAGKAALESVTLGEPAEGQTAEEHTRKLIMAGVNVMREFNFEYPIGIHTEVASDQAMVGFDQFYKGTTRMHTVFETKERGRYTSRDLEPYREIIACIPDEMMPKILNFLVTVYQNRALFKGQVLFCADKFAQFSPRFKAAVEARSERENRLPWLPELLPDPEPEQLVSSFLPEDAACTVLWIDKSSDAFENAKLLQVAGMKVVGFLDDWSKEASKATDQALSYILNAVPNPDEHVVAVIVNNGEKQKDMLKEILQYCDAKKKYPPFFAACTARGTLDDFEGCGVQFINKDRVLVQEAVLDYVARRRSDPDEQFMTPR